MTTNVEIFDNLFERWKAKNFALDFYFDKIFDQVLDSLHENTNHKLIQEIEGGKYKALFAPVGYSIENIAVITSFFNPEILMMAFSETSYRFHRKNLPLVKNNIQRICQNIVIDDVRIIGDDQKDTEKSVLDWIEDMKITNGFTSEQLAIDLTGGTKPMSIGAQNAALSFEEIDAFYLDVDYDETGFCDKCDGFVCNECWEFKGGKVVCPKCGKEIG